MGQSLQNMTFVATPKVVQTPKYSLPVMPQNTYSTQSGGLSQAQCPAQPQYGGAVGKGGKGWGGNSSKTHLVSTLVPHQVRLHNQHFIVTFVNAMIMAAYNAQNSQHHQTKGPS